MFAVLGSITSCSWGTFTWFRKVRTSVRNRTFDSP